jgi:hypothetical protein
MKIAIAEEKPEADQNGAGFGVEGTGQNIARLRGNGD